MIKSIKFNGEFGYIMNKIPEPICSVRGYDIKHYRDSFSEEEKELIAEYKKKMKIWKKRKDEFQNPHLVKNLLDRTFMFEQNKINLIFGPNASGKTTILKALAGNAGTKDGYSNPNTLFCPIDFKTVNWDAEPTAADFRKKLNNLMGNSADIDWDGAPIYYDNFSNRKSYGAIGDMCGSVLGDSIVTEVIYNMGKDKISKGQDSLYLFNRICNIASQKTSYAEIFKKFIDENGHIKYSFGMNDTWYNTYKIQLDYYLGHEKSFESAPSTFLFDELDKSMDILNVYTLYTEILPSLIEKTGIQIIIISHSPVVLSDKIRKSDKYNFISIDEDYTNKCIELLN